MIEEVYKWLDTANPGKRNLKDMISFVNEELEEFEGAVKTNDKKEQINAIVDALWQIYNISYQYGITKEELEKEHKLTYLSNFSKFCESREEALESQKLYSKGTHPNKPNQVIKTLINESEGWYVLKNADNLKILKSLNYKEPQHFEKYIKDGK